MNVDQCHHVPGLIAVASQLAYHVLHSAIVKKSTANVHTNKTEHVDMTEDEDLNEP